MFLEQWKSLVSVKDRLRLASADPRSATLALGIWIQAASSTTRLLASAAGGLLLSCPRFRSVRFDFTHRRHPTTAKMKFWSECLCEGLRDSMEYFITYISLLVFRLRLLFGRLSFS